jgi:hypothetical protein
MAQLQDIGPIYRGEDVTFQFTMVPTTDITGWTITLRVKAALMDPAALLTVSGTLQAPAAGVFTVPLTATQTQSLSAGQYAYDVWRTDSGSAANLSLGLLVVKSSVRVP